jgi:hypothetical protein
MNARTWLRTAAPLVLAVAMAACSARTGTPPVAPAAAPAPVVHDLAAVADLAARFDRDRDHPRIVLLLSPT